MLQKKILIIDDSDFYARCISDVLVTAGYQVIRAARGETGMRMVSSEKPDMVLLDVIMPDIDGFDVCRSLRACESNNLMPIIMLTAQDQQEDKLVGLELGADDYIIKPFNNRELLSRVANTLRRIDRNRGANPLTGLPGNLEIQREISRRIKSNEQFAAIYLDLDNFKAYNDVYGFARGDTAIKMTADIIKDADDEYGAPSDLTGHIGGDDFFLLTIPKKAQLIGQEIINQFDRRIREIYTADDLNRGSIQSCSRRGELLEYPIMTISLAEVTNECFPYESHIQVAETAASLKKYAKTLSGSNYVQDRRRS